MKELLKDPVFVISAGISLAILIYWIVGSIITFIDDIINRFFN